MWALSRSRAVASLQRDNDWCILGASPLRVVPLRVVVGSCSPSCTLCSTEQSRGALRVSRCGAVKPLQARSHMQRGHALQRVGAACQERRSERGEPAKMAALG